MICYFEIIVTGFLFFQVLSLLGKIDFKEAGLIRFTFSAAEIRGILYFFSFLAVVRISRVIMTYSPGGLFRISPDIAYFIVFFTVLVVFLSVVLSRAEIV